MDARGKNYIPVTPKQTRMIMRALCIALSDSMSAIKVDSLTYPPHEWKELIDLVAKVERRGNEV